MPEIARLASRYDFDFDDDVAAAGSAAGERGFHTKPELVLICEWKTVRSKSRVAQNTDGFVKRITGAALATDDERERIAALCVLRGVDVPSASVLLHFAFPDRYPIIDWRALESLGRHESPPYSIVYGLAYVAACRELAHRADVSVRALDEALSQYARAPVPTGDHSRWARTGFHTRVAAASRVACAGPVAERPLSRAPPSVSCPDPRAIGPDPRAMAP